MIFLEYLDDFFLHSVPSGNILHGQTFLCICVEDMISIANLHDFLPTNGMVKFYTLDICWLQFPHHSFIIQISCTHI